jgi:uncharacterized protein
MLRRSLRDDSRCPTIHVARRFMAIETPCNKVCAVDPVSALCVGCGRTLDEIASWLAFSAEQRSRIMAELPRRLAARRRLARSGAERADLG